MYCTCTAQNMNSAKKFLLGVVKGFNNNLSYLCFSHDVKYKMDFYGIILNRFHSDATTIILVVMTSVTQRRQKEISSYRITDYVQEVSGMCHRVIMITILFGFSFQLTSWVKLWFTKTIKYKRLKRI